MAISSAGLGSGLDVNSIVTSLMSVERKPLDNIAAQKTSNQAKISAFGSLKSALSTFQTALTALSSASKFNAQTVSSSNTSVLTATSNGAATLGSYDVAVSQLAKSQKLSLGGFANTTDVVGTGTLSISFGTFTPESGVAPAITPSSFTPNTAKTAINLTIDSSNNTLAGVRDAINAANASVSATIVNDGATNRLVITSKDSGEVNSLKISVTDSDSDHTDTAGLSRLAYDPTATAGSGKNLTEVQAAKNALLTIDGISIVKASNTITDAVSGVTLNLLGISTGAPISLGVTSNQDAVKESVKSFVDGYNKLDTTMRNLTKYDETGKSSGALLGDAATRSAINKIRGVLNTTIPNGSSLNSLSQIGVTFQRDGQLLLDSTKLANAVSSNFNGIASLFASTASATDAQISYSGSTSKTKEGTYAVTVTQLGSSTQNTQGTINGVAATGNETGLVGAVGNNAEGLSLKVAGGALGARGTVTFSKGYAAQLDTVIKDLLSTEGILTARTDGINSTIKRLDTQAASMNVRLTAIEARYRAQFTRLDTTLSSMSTTSSFLTQQIASINASK